MKALIMNIGKRLREPSTLAGLSILAALFGIPPGTVEGVAQIVAGACAVGAILLPENTNTAP